MNRTNETKKRKMDPNSDTGVNRAASSSVTEPDGAASGTPLSDNGQAKPNTGPSTKQSRSNRRKREIGHSSKQVPSTEKNMEIKSPLGYKPMEVIASLDDDQFMEKMINQKNAIILRMNTNGTKDEARFADLASQNPQTTKVLHEFAQAVQKDKFFSNQIVFKTTSHDDYEVRSNVHNFLRAGDINHPLLEVDFRLTDETRPPPAIHEDIDFDFRIYSIGKMQITYNKEWYEI